MGSDTVAGRRLWSCVKAVRTAAPRNRDLNVGPVSVQPARGVHFGPEPQVARLRTGAVRASYLLTALDSLAVRARTMMTRPACPRAGVRGDLQPMPWGACRELIVRHALRLHRRLFVGRRFSLFSLRLPVVRHADELGYVHCASWGPSLETICCGACQLALCQPLSKTHAVSGAARAAKSTPVATARRSAAASKTAGGVRRIGATVARTAVRAQKVCACASYGFRPLTHMRGRVLSSGRRWRRAHRGLHVAARYGDAVQVAVAQLVASRVAAARPEGASPPS